MRRSLLAALMLGAAALFVVPADSFAGEAASGDGVKKTRHHHARRGTRVKGFVARSGGGYSYIAADTINTYGDARGRYGVANSFRDPWFGRQTNGGPFDNGFFFDSGIGSPHGGDSPYMH